MKLLSSLSISASGLGAERLRMDVSASNIANAQSTRARKVNGKWIPYRRRQVVMASKGNAFSDVLNSRLEAASLKGVEVTQIKEDMSAFKKVHQPGHPDADENGYVLLPNVDLLTEMVDLTVAQRAYDANLTAFNAAKNMYLKALELSK